MLHSSIKISKRSLPVLKKSMIILTVKLSIKLTFSKKLQETFFMDFYPFL